MKHRHLLHRIMDSSVYANRHKEVQETEIILHKKMIQRLQTFTTGEHVEFPAADDDHNDEQYTTCNTQYYCQQIVVSGYNTTYPK